MRATPFIDPDTTRALYADGDRLGRRTGALQAAKIHGPGAASTIAQLAQLAQPATPTAPTVVDLGCGHGQTTHRLATYVEPRRLVALDLSPALLKATRRRTSQATAVAADFHRIPVPDGVVDLVVAAFCLYHSPHPERVITEISRCLAPGGGAIFATKSADSYTEIDQLLAQSGLDPRATEHPSLYTTFHADNAVEIIATGLPVEQIVRQHHVFRFRDLDHLAAYVATSPKYQLPPELTGQAPWLAAALRCRVPDRPLVATSTVAYVVGTRP